MMSKKADSVLVTVVTPLEMILRRGLLHKMKNITNTPSHLFTLIQQQCLESEASPTQTTTGDPPHPQQHLQ